MYEYEEEEPSAKEKRDKDRKFEPVSWLCDVDSYTKLVKQGFRIMDNMTTEERTAMVRKAVENKDLDLLKAMLDNGLQQHEVFPNKGREDVWMLLWEAIDVSKDEQEFVDIIQFLLDNGCSVDLEVKTCGWCDDVLSPLFLAIEKDLWKIVTLLLTRGADIKKGAVIQAIGASLNPGIFDIIENCGITFSKELTPCFVVGLLGGSMMFSTREHEHLYHKHQIQMIRFLRNNGFTLTPTESHADCTYFYDFLTECMTTDDDHIHEVLQFLVDSGSNVNADCETETALHYAALTHKEKVVRFLVENGANINVLDDTKKSPLLYLAKRSCALSNFELFKYLIQSGADVNVTGDEEEPYRTYTPRILAICMNENVTYLKHLLYLLDKCPVKLPWDLDELDFGSFPARRSLELEVFQPSVLYKLVQVGLGGRALFWEVANHAKRTQTRKGFDLVHQVNPNDRIKVIDQYHGLLSFMADEEETTLRGQIVKESRQPCSLVTWSIYTIRQHLIHTSKRISILPRIRQLAAEVPVDLRPMLTLDCYMVDDEDRNLRYVDQQKLYEHNMENLQLSEENIPSKRECKCDVYYFHNFK